MQYYYERGFTKQRDRGPTDAGFARINNSTRFLDAAGSDRPSINKFLSTEYYIKWERVQWWWLRDATENRTVAEVVVSMHATCGHLTSRPVYPRLL